jgi:outer membrane protein assembly factor BamB
LTTQTEDTGLHLLAIDRKRGEIVWDREIGRGKLHANNLHNMATPTAVSDDKLVWALFGTGDLACLDREGKVIWQRNLVKEYGEYKTNHGYGSSPMLLDGRLYIACMHQGHPTCSPWTRRAGRTFGRRPQPRAQDEAQDSYSVPSSCVKTDALSRARRVESVNAYDPVSGEQIWISGGLKVPHHFGRTISGPTVGEGVIVAVASGFQNKGYTIGLKGGGKGDITESHRLWTCNIFSADCPTPVIYDGKLFFIRDDGMASCLDVKNRRAVLAGNGSSARTSGFHRSPGTGKFTSCPGRGTRVVDRGGEAGGPGVKNQRSHSLATPAPSNVRQIVCSAWRGVFCIAVRKARIERISEARGSQTEWLRWLVLTTPRPHSTPLPRGEGEQSGALLVGRSSNTPAARRT